MIVPTSRLSTQEGFKASLIYRDSVSLNKGREEFGRDSHW